MKYYAVKRGRKPGVYKTWDECQDQVKGFNNAIYKSFMSKDLAESFIQDYYGYNNRFVNNINNNISNKDKEDIKWELNSIKEGLKARDIVYILDKVNSIANILGIELKEDCLDDYKRENKQEEIKHTITIGNIKTYKKRDNEIAIKVDRSNKILGNQFYMHNESERDYVCDQYELWIRQKIKEKDPSVINELKAIKEKLKDNNIVLLCWCAPKRCHAESIKRIIEEGVV